MDNDLAVYVTTLLAVAVGFSVVLSILLGRLFANLWASKQYLTGGTDFRLIAAGVRTRRLWIGVMMFVPSFVLFTVLMAAPMGKVFDYFF